MTFPGAGAQIYRNEAGEPTGWDYPQYDEGPDPDDFDDFDYDDYDEDDDEPDGPDDDDDEGDGPEDPNALVARLLADLEQERGLKVRYFGDAVVNIDRPGPDEVTNEDLDAFREVLRQAHYVEVESWRPRQGVSWLSDGVSAGVSFRIAPA